MEDSNLETELTNLKKQGVSFYNAAQILLKKGYKQIQIDEKAYIYTNPDEPKIKGPVNGTVMEGLLSESNAEMAQNMNEEAINLGPNDYGATGSQFGNLLGHRWIGHNYQFEKPTPVKDLTPEDSTSDNAEAVSNESETSNPKDQKSSWEVVFKLHLNYWSA